MEANLFLTAECLQRTRCRASVDVRLDEPLGCAGWLLNDTTNDWRLGHPLAIEEDVGEKEHD